MGLAIELDGLRALVTGSGQGVGLGIAQMLANGGAEVVVNDLSDERAAQAADAIRAAGGKAITATFDVTSYDAVAAGVKQVGGVDILVNNAGNAGGLGWPGMKAFVETEPADWEPFLRVNLYGVMNCVRAVLPRMVEKRYGRIVTIVSDAGRIGESHMGAYCAAKAGAAGLTRGVAREVGRYGITVNNIALGTMRTPMSEALWANPDSPQAKALMKPYIIRRPGDPSDPAGLTAYLVSPMASWITGQTFPVNGGYSVAQ
jgi:NAD(P)-dependent dehydrogenase (short-subunit alcohol dehydrogenase family)